MNKASLIDMKINSMTFDEMRDALKVYMLQDTLTDKIPVSVEVRYNHSLSNDKNGWYDVVFLLEDGSEMKVDFKERAGKLLYVYALRHPRGFQRRALAENDFSALVNLYTTLFACSSEKIKKPLHKDFDNFVSRAITLSRNALRKTLGKDNSAAFEIADPKAHNGKIIITKVRDCPEFAKVML